MHHRWGLIVAGLFGVILAGLLIWFLAAPAEPVYQGKKVSYWLDQRMTNSNLSNTRRAFHEMGPKSVPYIADKLRKQNSWGRKQYRQLWPWLPALFRNMLPQPQPKKLSDSLIELAAVNSFVEIGPAAIPALLHLLTDKNASVRLVTTWALESFIRSGHDMEASIPSLIAALRDRDPGVRSMSASALGRFGPKAAVAIPALIARLKDDDKGAEQGSKCFVRAAAARALGLIGPTAKPAVRALTGLLADGEKYTRMEATIALWRIERQASATVPLLLSELPKTDNSKWEILEAFREMGPEARLAVPAIVAELQSRDPRVWQWAAEALWKIDTSQVSVIVNALVEHLQDSREMPMQYSVVKAGELLAKIGPEGRVAVPMLLKLLEHRNPSVREGAAAALKKIDPEAAAMAGVE